MPQRYEIKGSNVISKLEFVEETFGATARSRLEASLEDKKLFPLFPAGWYPYDAYIGLLKIIARRYMRDNPERMEDLGRYSARKAFNSTYKSFLYKNAFKVFLDNLPSLYQMFYSFGRIVISVHEDEKRCEIEHKDVPAIQEIDLHVGAGFFQEAAIMHGIDGVDCTFRRESDSVMFTLTWD